MKVQKTKDYSQFKTVIGNRKLKKRYINRLARSIDKKNLLPAVPILVNERKEVVDGQHRLAAAEMLGLDIYYTVVDGTNIEDVIELNNSQRRWSIYEYLDLHCQLKNPEYLKLREFMNRHKLNAQPAILMASSLSSSPAATESFRKGGFIFDNEGEGDLMMSVITQLQAFAPSFTIKSDDTFVRALRRVRQAEIAEDAVDDDLLERLVHNYKSTGTVILPSTKTPGYLRQFEDVINHGIRGKHQTRLF